METALQADRGEQARWQQTERVKKTAYPNGSQQWYRQQVISEIKLLFSLTSSEFAFAMNHEVYNPKRCCQNKSSQVYDADIFDATVL